MKSLEIFITMNFLMKNGKLSFIDSRMNVDDTPTKCKLLLLQSIRRERLWWRR